MKRLLPLILLIPLAWCACISKSTVKPTTVDKGTITATIVGVDETFNISDSVYYFPKQPQTADWVFKASGRASNGDRIWFIIDYQAPILGGGTYNNNNDTSKPINVTMSYIMPGKQYICSTPSPVSVTLTTFTSTNVQGTFSGSPANNGEVKSVTNGKFNLDFATPVTITQ